MDKFWPFHRCNHKSHVRKKMTAVHFTIIPCESYKPIDYKESQIFAVFVPALAKFCMLGLKVENVSGVFFFISALSKLWCAKNLAKCIRRLLSVLEIAGNEIF